MLLVVILVFSSGCDTERLSQFATFAAAGSLYVQNLHQVVAQAGSSMIASDSVVLTASRNIAGKAVVSSHPDLYTKNVQTDDDELQQYLATLAVVDEHATMLGSYFNAVAQLANGKVGTNAATSAGNLLDEINKDYDPKLENATLKVGSASTTVKQFVQKTTPLVVAHFQVKALDDQLQKDAQKIDDALTLQEAALTAISSQMKDSLAVVLQSREWSDVIGPYVANVDSLPADWNAKREAFLRAKVTIDSVDSAKAAITHLHKDFKELVQNKSASINFDSLVNDLSKMSGYVSSLESTTKTK